MVCFDHHSSTYFDKIRVRQTLQEALKPYFYTTCSDKHNIFYPDVVQAFPYVKNIRNCGLNLVILLAKRTLEYANYLTVQYACNE